MMLVMRGGIDADNDDDNYYSLDTGDIKANCSITFLLTLGCSDQRLFITLKKGSLSQWEV